MTHSEKSTEKYLCFTSRFCNVFFCNICTYPTSAVGLQKMEIWGQVYRLTRHSVPLEVKKSECIGLNSDGELFKEAPFSISFSCKESMRFPHQKVTNEVRSREISLSCHSRNVSLYDTCQRNRIFYDSTEMNEICRVKSNICGQLKRGITISKR